MKIDRYPRLAFAYRYLLVRMGRFLHGIDPDKVVFSCYQGRSYGDNPLCISERLHQRRPGTKIVWLLNRSAEERLRNTLPDYVQPVTYKSKEALLQLATARVWIDNFTKHRFLSLAAGRQFYIQTWHGDRAIKKICYDMNLPGDGRRIEEKCSRVLTGSEFGEKLYRTAFHYRGKYIKAGSPRNDLLVKNDPEDIRRIREKLGIPHDVKVVLYAPTYRDEEYPNQRGDQIDLRRTLMCLEDKTGCEWMCLFRAHYLSKDVSIEESDRIVNVTNYDDMAELLLAADLFITDYSSAAMDYIIRDCPALFYIADWEDYAANRGVYFDVRNTPLMAASSQDELDALIRGLTAEKVRANCAEIREYFGYHETGHATDAVCDYIIERLGSRNNMPD